MFSAVVLIFWISAIVAGIMVGERKGHPVAGFLLTFLLGWLGVLIIACVPASHDAQVTRERDRQAVIREASQPPRMIPAPAPQPSTSWAARRWQARQDDKS